MKRLFISFVLLAAAGVLSAGAQRVCRIHRTDGVMLLVPLSLTDSITPGSDGQSVRFHLGSETGEVAVAEVDSLSFASSASEVVTVTYGTDGPQVVNPYAFRGVDVTVGTDGTVTATSTRDGEVVYELSGTGTGSFKLYSTRKQTLRLSGLCLESADGPAINIQSKKKTTVVLVDGTENTLTDAATYTAVDGEDMKAAFFSEGQLVFTGGGQLAVAGRYKHAICSDDYVSILGGDIAVTEAATDGIHANDYFSQSGGTLTVSGTAGDCIDAGEGYVQITGGTLSLTASAADTKAVKCDSTLSVSGGTLDIRLTGDQTKGLKSAGCVALSGGQLTFTCSGGAVVADGDVSYCTAVKADSLLLLSGGDLTITHTGVAGKGLSSDGAAVITGGTLTGTFSGAGGTYTNASIETDTYAATGLKADGDLTVQDGTLTLTCTGNGGKCISVGGAARFGDSSHSPALTLKTTGASLSGGSSDNPGGGPGGGGGGRPGGRTMAWGGGQPGGSTSSSGGLPKAIRCAGNLTIDGGTFAISTSSDGGEGMESKDTLTVNGGTLEVETYDDALQAANHIAIHGGRIFAYASNNDGIDSNGTLTITGGLIVSSGTTAPEEGFDCDQNTFSITGGTLFGIGGSNSTPTASATTQPAVVWSGASASQGTVYTVANASGGQVMSFTIPRAYGTASIVFSAPGLVKGSSYTLYTGGTLTGGEAFHGLTTGATFSGGTSVRTATLTSTITSMR